MTDQRNGKEKEYDDLCQQVEKLNMTLKEKDVCGLFYILFSVFDCSTTLICLPGCFGRDWKKPWWNYKGGIQKGYTDWEASEQSYPRNVSFVTVDYKMCCKIYFSNFHEYVNRDRREKLADEIESMRTERKDYQDEIKTKQKEIVKLTKELEVCNCGCVQSNTENVIT